MTPGAAGRRDGMDPALFVAALLSLMCAVVHLAVAPGHFSEWTAFGVAFVVTAAAQLAWSAQLTRSVSPALLRAGVGPNFAIVAVWVWSRTVGLPVGPEAGEPERVGLLDALTSLDELLIAAIVMAVLRRGSWSPQHRSLAGLELTGGVALSARGSSY